MEQIGGSAYVIAVLTMNIGAALVSAGDMAEARRHLDASRALFEQVKARDFDPELHRHYSEAAHHEGDHEEARAQAQLALDTALELGDHGEEGIAKRLLAELAHARDEHEQAERLLLESIATLAEAAEEHELARARLALAELYADPHVGRRAEADEVLSLCAPVFERLGASREIARVRMLRETLDA
jgi:tetratricopeptide (TPR) repeat protein